MQYLNASPIKEQSEVMQELELEGNLRQIASSLTQAAAETASAFFNANASPCSKWNTPIRNDLGSLHCSQRNIGDKFEMTFNLAVEKVKWDHIFPTLISDRYKTDAFCELANCISGTILAQSDFNEIFGNMIPCVPFALASSAPQGSKTLQGAFRLAGILVYFSITILQAGKNISIHDLPLAVKQPWD